MQLTDSTCRNNYNLFEDMESAQRNFGEGFIDDGFNFRVSAYDGYLLVQQYVETAVTALLADLVDEPVDSLYYGLGYAGARIGELAGAIGYPAFEDAVRKGVLKAKSRQQLMEAK